MMSRLLLSIICHGLLNCVLSTEREINLEEFFKESHCIPEPSEDFLSQFMLRNEAGGSISTKTVKDITNYRAQLNLLVQYNKLEFKYNTEHEEGPVHERMFNVSVQIGDEIFYGIGKSKKEAREMAAKHAIENTSYQKPQNKIDADIMNENAPPTVILNNLGSRHGYKIQYFMVDPKLSKRVINLKLLKDKSQLTNSSFWKVTANLDEPPRSPFSIEVDVNGESFYAKSHTIQSAKHEAALKAIEFLKKKGLDKKSVCTSKGHENECAEAKAKLKSPISILYEYAQRMRLPLEFKELDKTGPAHKLIFETECILGSERVSAKGKSKKEAKKMAAMMMLEKIPDVELSEDLNADELESGAGNLKKRKKPKTLLDDSKDVLHNIVNLFSSSDDTGTLDDDDMKSNDDNKRQSKKRINHDTKDWSPKEKVIDSGKALNLNIKFYSMAREKSGVYSILSMDVNPTYICLGIGPNTEISQEYASLHALKFLYNLDVLEGVEQEDLSINRFSFDNYIWLTKEHTEEL